MTGARGAAAGVRSGAATAAGLRGEKGERLASLRGEKGERLASGTTLPAAEGTRGEAALRGMMLRRTLPAAAGLATVAAAGAGAGALGVAGARLVAATPAALAVRAGDSDADVVPERRPLRRERAGDAVAERLGAAEARAIAGAGLSARTTPCMASDPMASSGGGGEGVREGRGRRA